MTKSYRLHYHSLQRLVTTYCMTEIWKASTVILIPKPDKDIFQCTLYRPISLLCPVVNVLETLILPNVNAHLPPAAPNGTAYKRCSCHSGLKLLCKLCRTSPPPVMGARFTVFWACRPCGPAGAAAHKSG